MEGQYNLRSPAVKRLMKEAQELREPTEQFYAQPLEDNLFEWHFTIRGPADSEFDGGIYHGRIVLPPEYPMKPPSIIILTPNGRFETHKKICLSISGYHPESWQPSWSLRTALLAIIGFMPTHGNGAIGSLDYTPEERKLLAKKSQDWKCEHCGYVRSLVHPVTEASQALSKEAKELGSQIKLQGEKEKPPTSESSVLSSEANLSSTSADTAAASAPTAAAAVSVPSAAQFAAFPSPFFCPPPFAPQMMMTSATTSTSTTPPLAGLPPFMSLQPPYAGGRMPFIPPMMPFFGSVPPSFLPPTGVGMPPYVPGPGRFPFMPPSTMFPATSFGSLSTVASSVSPTSVVWAGVAHPMPSATVQSTTSEVRSSLNVEQLSSSVSSPVNTSQPASSSQTATAAPASASPSNSHTGNMQAAPASPSTPRTGNTAAAAGAERDDDPVLSASELRRRQRTSPQVTVRTVRQPAELPARASSHISHLFGNVILAALMLCICLLVAHRLYIIVGHL